MEDVNKESDISFAITNYNKGMQKAKDADEAFRALQSWAILHEHPTLAEKVREEESDDGRSNT